MFSKEKKKCIDRDGDEEGGVERLRMEQILFVGSVVNVHVTLSYVRQSGEQRKEGEDITDIMKRFHDKGRQILPC